MPTQRIPTVALVPFMVLSFAIAWGILGGYILMGSAMERLFGPLTGSSPMFYLCVYAPAIVALVVICLFAGPRALPAFFSRLLLWRASLGWYAFLLLGIPAVFYAGALIKGLLDTAPDFGTLTALLTALLLAAIKGPVEELGWRGVALPLLQRRMSPFGASIVLGTIWGIWHLPAFLLSGTQQSEWTFAPFFVGCIAISLIATQLYNHSRGSILLVAFFHFMLMNPVFPDAQPYDSLGLLLIAGVLAWRNPAHMFSREHAVVRVIPDTSAATLRT